MKKLISKFAVFCAVLAVFALFSFSASASEPYSSFWSTTSFPYALGEDSLDDIKNVDVFYATEFKREGWSYDVAVNPMIYAWYQIYEGSAFSSYSYPEVYARIGGEWVDVTNVPCGSTDFDVYPNFHLGCYDGQDSLSGIDSPFTYDHPLTYGDYFSAALSGFYTEAKHAAPTHSFAVRWSAVADGVRSYFAYIAHAISIDSLGGDASTQSYNLVEYLGNKAHPAQAMYWGNAALASEYDILLEEKDAQLASLQAQKDQLQTRYDELYADFNDTWEIAYEEGYNAGLSAGLAGGTVGGVGGTQSPDYIIDDSSVQSTVISFIAVCFRGVRDAIMPFLEIEFFGFSVLQFAAVVVCGSFIVGVVFFILKFIRG